ncbi:hypothetical protein [Deinococcus koreensis]|nr:hypothetical protein [Deinococcus koreensis]
MPTTHRWTALAAAALLSFAPAQSAPQPSLREELVSQALAGWDGSATVTLLPGALPGGFAIQLSGLPGVRLVGTVDRRAPTPEQGGQTVILSGSDVGGLDSAVRRALTGAGFQPFPQPRDREMGGGFLPTGGGSFSTVYFRRASGAGPGGLRASLTVYQQGGRPYAQLGVNEAPQLAEEIRTAQGFAELGLYGSLPALTPPAGVTVFPTGGGGGSGGFTVSARIQGTLTPAQLSDHYSAQLRAKGWQALSRVTPRDQVVTVWSFQQDGQAVTGILAFRQGAPGTVTAMLSTITY